MAPKNFMGQYRADDGFISLDFTFNYKTKTGDLVCNKSGPYPVYEGLCLFFPIVGESAAWLLGEWNKATEKLGDVDLYRGRKTELKFNTANSFLLDMYCPICLQQKSVFEGHHCVARSDGGKDGYRNVLRICASCHAPITWGCFEERWPKDNAALYHQVMYFDYGVYPREFRKVLMPELEDDYYQKARFEKILAAFDLSNEHEKSSQQRIMRKFARYYYQFYRDVGLGIRNWKKEIKLFPQLYRDFQKEFEWIKFPNPAQP